MQPDDPRHGTVAGAIAHRRAGVPKCDECKKASADYERRRYCDTYLGKPRKVPAIGSLRRVQALYRIDWPGAELSKRLGVKDRSALNRLFYRSETCTAQTAERIRRLYDELSMIPGPSRVTALRAQRSGYAPPFAWDNIDDPDEKPRGHVATTRSRLRAHTDVDPARVQRILGGDWALAGEATKAEKREVCRRWCALGGALNDLERLTGWQGNRYWKVDAA